MGSAMLGWAAGSGIVEFLLIPQDFRGFAVGMQLSVVKGLMCHSPGGFIFKCTALYPAEERIAGVYLIAADSIVWGLNEETESSFLVSESMAPPSGGLLTVVSVCFVFGPGSSVFQNI